MKSRDGPPCPRCGRARRAYRSHVPRADELCGYCRNGEAQRGNQYAVGHGPPGVPVYDEAGELFARSMAAAARQFGVRTHALYPHIVEYRDGYQLHSRPDPANAGHPGGRRKRRA
jgi:hypothetical protein